MTAQPVSSRYELSLQSQRAPSTPADTLPESEIEQRFLKLSSVFQEAAGTIPDQLVESRLSLAGRSVHFRVLGTCLAKQIVRAFPHVTEPELMFADPQLIVEFWSRAATCVEPPDLSWMQEGMRHWPTGIGGLLSSECGRFVGCITENEAVCLDRERRHIVGYCASLQDLSLFFQGRPFFFPLSLWHRDNDVQLVHAALVGRNGSGVLIPGCSGAGKSTTAVACALGGLDYLGDDHVGLAINGQGEWEGFGIYASAWLEPHQQRRFKELCHGEIAGKSPSDDKNLVFVGDVVPIAPCCRTLIRAVALPRIVDAEQSAYTAASKGDALKGIALGTIGSVIPRPAPDDLKRIANFIDATPCYLLEVGRRLDDIPNILGQLLDEVSPS